MSPRIGRHERYERASMLKKLPIPNFTERLYGFTIPSAGKVYACDHDESFEIMLGEAPKIVVLEDNPYEFIGSFENALGAFGGKPIHQINGIRVSYSFDGSEDYVAVVVSLENSSETISFRTLSGDWFVATLSVCGRYLVLAEPYLFECYEFV